MVTLNMQMFMDFLKIRFINNLEYFWGKGITLYLNLDFVPKLCNLEHEKYTFFLILTKILMI